MATVRDGDKGVLLVVDVQVGVMRVCTESARAIGQVALAVELARSCGAPVLWVQHASNSLVIGKPDFSGLTFTINDAVFRYGAFITQVITFVAIAAAVFFFVVKPMQMVMARVKKSAEEVVSDEERRHQELLAALRGRN